MTASKRPPIPVKHSIERLAVSATRHEPQLASMASVIADPSRSRMLCYLLSGEYASAGELARAGSVAASTASGHLQKLLDAKLLVCEQRGRHRYYKLADADVAHALEALALVAERKTHESAWANPSRSRLRYARCCYGHLAGKLGVELFAHMQAQHWLAPHEGGWSLTDKGLAQWDMLGVDASIGMHPPSSRKASGRMAYPCLDWSERKDHMAGQLAKALLDQFLEKGWLLKLAGERALELTPVGRQRLGGLLPSANALV